MQGKGLRIGACDSCGKRAILAEIKISTRIVCLCKDCLLLSLERINDYVLASRKDDTLRETH